jgi:hypothetical protein
MVVMNADVEMNPVTRVVYPCEHKMRLPVYTDGPFVFIAKIKINLVYT